MLAYSISRKRSSLPPCLPVFTSHYLLQIDSPHFRPHFTPHFTTHFTLHFLHIFCLFCSHFSHWGYVKCFWCYRIQGFKFATAGRNSVMFHPLLSLHCSRGHRLCAINSSCQDKNTVKTSFAEKFAKIISILYDKVVLRSLDIDGGIV